MNSKVRILVIDDEKINLNILIGLLGDRYEVVVALNAKKALEILDKKDVNLILLDIVMPGIDGFEVCSILKKQAHTQDIPVIFITVESDEKTIEEAYGIGGIDFITKPFKPKELLAKVKRELRLQEMQKELQLLASTDPMTKLYNRRYFTNASAHIFDLAKRDKRALSMIMLDIDNFKLVNDTYGHKTGDDVIVNLANILHTQQRKSDIICRFGGEEFLILLPNTTSKNAEIIAEKIRVSVEKSSIYLNEKKSIHYTVSLGVSEVGTQNEKNIEEAIKRADKALYNAKETGKNKICTEALIV